MAALNGQITALCLYGPEAADNWSVDLSGFDIDDYLDLDISYSGLSTMHNLRVIVYPYVYAPAVSGRLNLCYADDYYNRIHLYPNPLALGNMLSDVADNVYVWNAYFTPKTLFSVEEINTDGIEISEPEAAPTTFAALEERTYVVSTSMDGPPAIAASVLFNFSDTLTLLITGSRVVIWRWRPDIPYVERLDWLTKILPTRSGEQRIALRDCPRQKFDLHFTKRPNEFSAIKTTAQEWAFRLWGLPIWSEQTRVSDVTADATAISFDTTSADYRAGGLAVLWQSSDNLEAVEIDTVRPDGLDLARGVSQSYDHVYIMPLRLAYTPEGINISRSDKFFSKLSANFIVTDNVDLAASSSYDQYRGDDVLTDGDIIVGTMSERISRPVTLFDNGQGPIVVETGQDWTRFARTLGKASSGKAARWLWRVWLHSRYGRQKPFWLPTWNQDMTIISDVGGSAVVIEIATIGISTMTEMPVDIMIRLVDGTVFYRRVTDATGLSDSETITIDTDLGQAVTVDDIDLCCFIHLVRLNADSVEIRHTKPGRTITSIPVMEVAA